MLARSAALNASDDAARQFRDAAERMEVAAQAGDVVAFLGADKALEVDR